MRVTMVSTSYPFDPADWRGRFIKDLVYALAEDDAIELSLWAPPGEIPGNVVYRAAGTEAAWLKDLLARGGIAHLIRSRTIGGLEAVFKLLYLLRKNYLRDLQADVVHVNWLQNVLPLWGTSVPAVVSVLGTDFGLLRVPGITRMIRAVLRQRRCLIAPNAGWMVPELEKRFGDVAEIRPVPFGVDTRWFPIRPIRTPDAPRRWLVVSRVTEKKIGPLFSWGEGLFGADDELHLLGPMQEDIPIPRWVHYHGPTNPDALEGHWFPRASGLITVSRHDEGRPQVILEAMAARLPVLASDIPAHRDVITHRETGWLVNTREEFAKGLEWLGNPDRNEATGSNAHDWVTQEIGTWRDCAARYRTAYQTVTGMRS
jgi:glycosyltransferase involved in cell wall biosynthesis